MSKRERLELTFGEKDADLWQYIESFGLPKAALVKKMIRDQMEAVQQPTQPVTVAAPLIVEQPVAEEQLTKPTEQPIMDKPKSPFGGLAVKK